MTSFHLICCQWVQDECFHTFSCFQVFRALCCCLWCVSSINSSCSLCLRMSSSAFCCSLSRSTASFLMRSSSSNILLWRTTQSSFLDRSIIVKLPLTLPQTTPKVSNLQLDVSGVWNPIVEAEQEDAGDESRQHQRRRATATSTIPKGTHHALSQSHKHPNDGFLKGKVSNLYHLIGVTFLLDLFFTDDSQECLHLLGWTLCCNSIAY